MAFQFDQGQWFLSAETDSGSKQRVDLVSLAEKFGPEAFYLYDIGDAKQRAKALLQSSFSVHFAMKANSCLHLLRSMASTGLGVDVVSVGEMQKALQSGFAPERVIYSGVAKDTDDLLFAVRNNVFQINVESFAELELLEQVALQVKRPVAFALRLNIHLIAPTHQHIQTARPDSKFGVDIEQLPEILDWLRGKSHLRLKGLATHIGSQIQDMSVFGAMAEKIGKIYLEVKAQGFPLERLDLGGGLGVHYETTGADDLERVKQYLQVLKTSHGTDAQVLIEPGRFLVARMGLLLARVIYVKRTPRKNFLILNAGMNALMRPALYQSFHRIEALKPRAEKEVYTVVGPICESTDQFAVDREMPKLERGDWVGIFDVGAYGAVMASTYNECAKPKQWSYEQGKWEVE